MEALAANRREHSVAAGSGMISAACVRFMFGKTSLVLACVYFMMMSAHGRFYPFVSKIQLGIRRCGILLQTE